jgi:hypothetical protein
MLNDGDVKVLAQELGKKIGLPAEFQGDRLDAFRLGASLAIEVIKSKVTLDKVEDKKEGGK